MTGYRKYAAFQLGVVILSAIAVISLYAWSGNTMVSLAGFSLLCLMGFREAILRGSGTPRPIQDERDDAIRQRATGSGYVALWLALVAWGVAIPVVFGERGMVPLAWVAPVVWVAWWLVSLVQSVTILMLDRRGS